MICLSMAFCGRATPLFYSYPKVLLPSPYSYQTPYSMCTLQLVTAWWAVITECCVHVTAWWAVITECCVHGSRRQYCHRGTVTVWHGVQRRRQLRAGECAAHFHPLSAIPYAHCPPRVDSLRNPKPIGDGHYRAFPADRKPATANYVFACLSTRYRGLLDVQLV